MINGVFKKIACGYGSLFFLVISCHPKASPPSRQPLSAKPLKPNLSASHSLRSYNSTTTKEIKFWSGLPKFCEVFLDEKTASYCVNCQTSQNLTIIRCDDTLTSFPSCQHNKEILKCQYSEKLYIKLLDSKEEVFYSNFKQLIEMTQSILLQSSTKHLKTATRFNYVINWVLTNYSQLLDNNMIEDIKLRKKLFQKLSSTHKNNLDLEKIFLKFNQKYQKQQKKGEIKTELAKELILEIVSKIFLGNKSLADKIKNIDLTGIEQSY